MASKNMETQAKADYWLLMAKPSIHTILVSYLEI